MVTGYEVGMYNDIGEIRRALVKLAKEAERAVDALEVLGDILRTPEAEHPPTDQESGPRDALDMS